MSQRLIVSDTFLSVVAPVRDASPWIATAIGEMDALLQGAFRNYEIVLVDDASQDDTVEIILRLQKSVPNLQLYCLNRRRGLQVALVAGLDNSIGDFVITLNLETDSPSLIPCLWEYAAAGNESACGVRQGGRTGLLGKMFYRLFFASTGHRIPPGITDLRLFSRRVVNYIGQNNDRHMLLKVLPFFVLRKVPTLEYAAQSRPGGFGDSGARTSALGAVAILLATSVRPLRFLTLMAMVASSLSLAYAVYVVVVAVFKAHVVEGWVSLALPMAAMFFFLSMILGVLSEYIYLLAQQSGNRPVYSIISESTSSVLNVQRKLNVVDGSGEFADRRADL